MITILLEKILAALIQLLGGIKTKLNTIKNNLNNLIVVATVTGPIASFTTTLTRPLLSCIVAIPESISGTDTVIVTQTGANLWDEQWEVGSLTASGSDYASTTRIRSKGYIPIAGGVICYMKSSSIADIHFYDINKEHISYLQRSNNTFEVPANAKYIRFCLSTDYGTTYGNDISINYPSTDTAYHAHVNATTKTVSLPSTVYGGEVDCIGGSGESNYGIITYNGSEDWQRTAGGSYYINNSDMKSGVNMSGVSNMFAVSQDTTIGTIRLGNAVGNTPNQRIYFVDDGTQYADVTAWKTFLSSNNLTVCYPLATPTQITLANPIDLTAISGVNNIFSDSGDVTVEYLKLYKEV